MARLRARARADKSLGSFARLDAAGVCDVGGLPGRAAGRFLCLGLRRVLIQVLILVIAVVAAASIVCRQPQRLPARVPEGDVV